MPKQSAGLILYRQSQKLEILLVHPGGPFWAKKDKGVWSIPKGEFTDENPLAAAKREFKEEIGMVAPDDAHDELYTELGTIKMSSGKVVHAWAVEGDFDPTLLVSNTTTIDWPPRSGQKMEIPEVDRAAWFTLEQAQTKLHPSQVPFLERMAVEMGADFSSPTQLPMF